MKVARAYASQHMSGKCDAHLRQQSTGSLYLSPPAVHRIVTETAECHTFMRRADSMSSGDHTEAMIIFSSTDISRTRSGDELRLSCMSSAHGGYNIASCLPLASAQSNREDTRPYIFKRTATSPHTVLLQPIFDQHERTSTLPSASAGARNLVGRSPKGRARLCLRSLLSSGPSASLSALRC